MTPSEGWICPVCKSGVAPTVSKCPCRSRYAVEPWQPVKPPDLPYTIGVHPDRPFPEVRFIDDPPTPDHPFTNSADTGPITNDATNRFP